MPSIIQYIINQGISQEIITLLLMVPIMATIVAFSRQAIGIKGFGIYTTLIITFCFLNIGLLYGFALFISLLSAGTLTRFIVKRFRLLYLPRMAISLIVLIIILFPIFLAISYFSQNKLILDSSIFTILILAVFTEKFIASQIERGAKKSIVLTIETLVLATICYAIANWLWLQNIISKHPLWIIPVALIVNIFLGTWTGLRLSEHWRFRKVINYVDLPKKK